MENYTATLVKEVLHEYRSKSSACDCEKCERDILATVLNTMAPRYFYSDTTEGEKVAYVLDKKLRFEALIQIAEAVKVVCAQNHPEEESET